MGLSIWLVPLSCPITRLALFSRKGVDTARRPAVHPNKEYKIFEKWTLTQPWREMNAVPSMVSISPQPWMNTYPPAAPKRPLSTSLLFEGHSILTSAELQTWSNRTANRNVWCDRRRGSRLLQSTMLPNVSSKLPASIGVSWISPWSIESITMTNSRPKIVQAMTDIRIWRNIYDKPPPEEQRAWRLIPRIAETEQIAPDWVGWLLGTIYRALPLLHTQPDTFPSTWTC